MTEIKIDKKIKLRSWTINDSARLAELANNYLIWINMRDDFPHPYTGENAEKWLNQIAIPNQDKYFAIEYKDVLAGDIHLKILDDVRRYNAVLTYWIGEKYWNKGIATRTIKTFTNYAFEKFGLVRVYAKIFSTNIGSIKAIEKAGYIKEGHFKHAIVKENKFQDQVLYAITKDEYIRDKWPDK